MRPSEENPFAKAELVEVALPLPLRRCFTYGIPAALRKSLRFGARVLVPFGKRSLTGYAISPLAADAIESGLEVDAIRDISEIIDEEPLLTPEILELSRWTADYYAASLGEVLKASLPAGINQAIERVVTITESGREELARAKNERHAKIRLLAHLRDSGETPMRDLEREFGKAAAKRLVRERASAGFVSVADRAAATRVRPKIRKAVRLLPDAETGEKSFSSAQISIIETLAAAGGEMFFTELLEAASVGASPITTLARRGTLEVFPREVLRDPLADVALPEPDAIILNAEQQIVLDEILGAINSTGYAAFLLHGVTGSGKTEVYIRAMKSALSQGKSALMLVPEIALTPIFSRRLRAVFGDAVAILHSNLSPGERFDEWRRIRAGNARIAIGTRSAVFAPLSNIGLVIVDEEHDSSYRQNESPYYNARDVAVKRAHSAGAAIVLGSATPALESFHNAQTGKYRYVRLPNRIGGRPLAKAELIDMREVFKSAGKDLVFSPKLIDAIEETHRKGEQSMILLNRRGFSSFVLCRSCGESLRCKNCDITMTFHRRDARLVCHYCGHTTDTPQKCPFCQSEFLYFIGQGTEQIEDILNKRFRHLRIARIDRDTMTKKGEMARTLLAFDSGEIDMLVGTQMLAKGHDFHNVTLVGVVSVDTGLGLPDFRSAERTFQLLTQMAGRAGRGNLPGRVLIQTYYPEHYALRHAAMQNFEGFYAEEIRFRQRWSYPPFSAIASILVRHRDQNYAVRSARLVGEALQRANRNNACRILGPAQASIARMKNEYRMQIIIKCENRRTLRETLDDALADAESRGSDRRIVHLEIDPVNLM